MLRMLRGPLSAVALLTPVAAFTGAQGCSSEPDIENLCTWLVDSSNCAARFSEDIGLQCGAAPSPDPAVALGPGNELIQNTTGTFLARDKLDLCVRATGGQVKFDPPLDINAFPPAAFGFKIVTQYGGDCGSGSYAGPLNFSLSVNMVDPADAAMDPSSTGEFIQGGSYSSAQEAGRDTFDVACPGGQETHHFNQLMLQKCEDAGPPAADYLPRAILDASAGLAETPISPTETLPGMPGYVRLRVVFPPVNPALGGAPTVVEYFNCAIPAPPNPCQDSVKNGTETDIDCGGTVCPGRCLSGQFCATGADCLSGNCVSNSGILMCG
jgi:hypothetical protein